MSNLAKKNIEPKLTKAALLRANAIASKVHSNQDSISPKKSILTKSNVHLSNTFTGLPMNSSTIPLKISSMVKASKSQRELSR